MNFVIVIKCFYCFWSNLFQFEGHHVAPCVLLLLSLLHVLLMVYIIIQMVSYNAFVVCWCGCSREQDGCRGFDCSLGLEWSLCWVGFLNVSIEWVCDVSSTPSSISWYWLVGVLGCSLVLVIVFWACFLFHWCLSFSIKSTSCSL